jgi:predicted ribonuclease YlaK
MNLLMDPEIDFVTHPGTAGTGKTLMARQRLDGAG